MFDVSKYGLERLFRLAPVTVNPLNHSVIEIQPVVLLQQQVQRLGSNGELNLETTINVTLRNIS